MSRWSTPGEAYAYETGYIEGSADARENVHGKWVPGKELSREMCAGQVLHIDYENFRCSVCGLVIDSFLYHVDGSPFYKFCPNCGADMRGENNE